MMDITGDGATFFLVCSGIALIFMGISLFILVLKD